MSFISVETLFLWLKEQPDSFEKNINIKECNEDPFFLGRKHSLSIFENETTSIRSSENIETFGEDNNKILNQKFKIIKFEEPFQRETKQEKSWKREQITKAFETVFINYISPKFKNYLRKLNKNKFKHFLNNILKTETTNYSKKKEILQTKLIILIKKYIETHQFENEKRVIENLHLIWNCGKLNELIHLTLQDLITEFYESFYKNKKIFEKLQKNKRFEDLVKMNKEFAMISDIGYSLINFGYFKESNGEKSFGYLKFFCGENNENILKANMQLG